VRRFNDCYCHIRKELIQISGQEVKKNSVTDVVADVESFETANGCFWQIH
jgi:hypothetical protein